MKNASKKTAALFLLTFLLLYPSILNATIRLPYFFSDNIELQQHTDAAIWCWAKPGCTVQITASWNKKKYSVATNNDGKWKIKVTTPEASGPYEISIGDGSPVTIKNILIGDVWLSSGQSNMEMPMKGFKDQPILNSNDAISNSTNNNSAGRSDVIFNMNSRDDIPGYGFQLKHGDAALTESWQAYESVSNNHFMLGHLMEWFYTGLTGIEQSATSVAYKNIEIKPGPVGDVTDAKATDQSPYGLIISDWKKRGNRFEFNITIPANTTAVVYLPVQKKSEIKEAGKKWGNVLYQDNKAIIKLGSGNYYFSVQ